MALDPTRRSASSGSAGLRIGDAEREQAVQSLGEHLRAGRLSVTEYDERLEQAFAARTDAELTPLFTDLPGGAPRSEPPPTPRRRDRRAYRVPVPLRAVVVLALVAGAIAWTALLAFPPLFLIPLLWFFLGRRFGGRRRYGARRHYGARRNYDYVGPGRF
jgi:Domain of unknown function (DUF1707)